MNKENVLIVEDDPQIMEMCKIGLQKNRYIVDESAMGRQALDLLDKKNYNLVLLDLNLPDTDGMEILKTIKTKHLNTDIIIMTGAGSSELRNEAIKLGAYDYIKKPTLFKKNIKAGSKSGKSKGVETGFKWIANAKIGVE